jgi:signal transduction histidine kinase
MKRKRFKDLELPPMTNEHSRSEEALPNSSILILTDETEFARAASACWKTQRKSPDITVLNSKLWRNYHDLVHDLIVVGPISGGKLAAVLSSLSDSDAVILCVPPGLHEADDSPTRYPKFPYVHLRDDWPHTLMLVARETLRRVEALQLVRLAEREATNSQRLATLGRYMTDMKHSMNNALTSMLGNAELLMLEPGQLSTQSLGQIKTIHSMAMRINEIMQRFSLLTTEMREAENASQAETDKTSVTTNHIR